MIYFPLNFVCGAVHRSNLQRGVMQDRLTQSHLLPHGPALKGRQARAARRARFRRAYSALPQVQAVKHFNRAVGRIIAMLLGMLWALISPLLYRLGRWIAGLFTALWRWFLQTPPVCAVRDWWHRTEKAVLALPQYQFLCRAHRFFKGHPFLRFMRLAAIIVALFLPSCLSAPAQPSQTVYLVVDGTVPQVISSYPAEDTEYDILRVSADDSGYDAQLILEEGQQVALRHGDFRCTAASRHETVANFLRRMNVTPAEDEMVAINISGAMPIIHISDELHYQRNEITPVAHTTKNITNPLAAKGSHTVIREGKDGTIMDTYDDVYRMGKVVQSNLIDRTDNTSVTEIVEIGTLVDTVPYEDKLAEVHPFRDGTEGGYLVFESGDSVRYTQKVICNTTAYYSGGEHGARWTTATGHDVGYGIIAADPKVFPYHSHLYVSGYGFSQIEDCGNFSGYALDVWYETYWQCAVWGRRHVTVYVIA